MSYEQFLPRNHQGSYEDAGEWGSMASSPASSPGVKDTSANPASPVQQAHTELAATIAGYASIGWQESHLKGPLQTDPSKVTTRPTGPASKDTVRQSWC